MNLNATVADVEILIALAEMVHLALEIVIWSTAIGLLVDDLAHLAKDVLGLLYVVMFVELDGLSAVVATSVDVVV